MGFTYSIGFKTDDVVQGAALFVQRLVTPYVGFEVSAEGFQRIMTADGEVDGSGVIGLSVLLFPTGSHNEGFNWYLRGGVFTPLFFEGMDNEQALRERGRPVASFWYGGGVQWRSDCGILSMSLEGVWSEDMLFSLYNPMEQTFLIRWHTGIHW